jgi:hypothetical protein
MSEHTPGPWKTNGDPYVSTADGKRSIAFCDTRQAHEDRANARLIAAAPDLLEALQGFQKAWDENRLLTSDEAASIRAAIAKATEAA